MPDISYELEIKILNYPDIFSRSGICSSGSGSHTLFVDNDDLLLRDILEGMATNQNRRTTSYGLREYFDVSTLLIEEARMIIRGVSRDPDEQSVDPRRYPPLGSYSTLNEPIVLTIELPAQ